MTLDHRFTINGPLTFTSSWKVLRPMMRIDISDRRSIFEYACHEGNYGLEGILAGARAEERRARTVRPHVSWEYLPAAPDSLA